MSLILTAITSEELQAELAPLGVPPHLARRFYAAAFRHDALPEQIEEMSKATLAEVRARTALPRLTLLDKTVSPRDGFAKFLFRGAGPGEFEAVQIPLLHRADDPKYVVCVSSQVGCGMGCVFCATGRMGFRRNLAAWEIVDQVLQIRAASPHPVRGVVFMGMGEPLLNYDNVLRACRVLCDPCGPAIGAKAITISTVGIVPGIRRLIAEPQPVRLVISLTAADAGKRRALFPVEKAYPTADLIGALREYHQATGQRVMLAWTMIAGVNTSEEDARQLAELTRGLPVKLDLIDVNDATGRFAPPNDAERKAFRDALSKHLKAPVARRYSGGADIRAACGMLVAREMLRPAAGE